MKSKTKIKVRYVETDAMRIVHHASYYVYFECAREDFINKFGLEYKEIESLGIMMPLVETQCKYIEAARYGDNLIVETECEVLSPVKIGLKYSAIRECDKKVLAIGKTVQTFVDSSTFRIINLKRVQPELWNKLNNY